MKSLIILLTLLPSLAFAETIQPYNLETIGANVFSQTVHTYNLEIIDSNGSIIKNTDFEYPSTRTETKITKNISYTELCLKNKDKFVYSSKDTIMTLSIDMSKPYYDDSFLNITADVPYLQSISLGDCDIQTPIPQHFAISTILPFIFYEQKYKIIDNSNTLTNKEYTIKINRK